MITMLTSKELGNLQCVVNVFTISHHVHGYLRPKGALFRHFPHLFEKYTPNAAQSPVVHLPGSHSTFDRYMAMVLKDAHPYTGRNIYSNIDEWHCFQESLGNSQRRMF
ncbi:hypothetical protein K439DRAFT_1622171 [Ramaria rubella]|nr:hypothetical protein K439DRAFT_1622171 [Ramaria rubella]